LPNKYKIKKIFIKKVEIMNIIGRVTKDAEIRTLSNNKQVVNFSVAINDSYKNKAGERIEQTTYFDCAYWLSPKVAQILTKGTVVELTGKVSARAWTGNNGEVHAGLNFHTSQIKLHGGSRKAETVQATAQTKNNKVTAQETADDLPF
jgi:single-strand DNA-binding protein